MRNPKKDGLTNKSQLITVARDRQSCKKTSLPSERRPVLSIALLARTQPTKGAGTLRRAVRRQAFARIPGGRHMECAYYFDIPGGRHMECAYYFDFCRLCHNGVVSLATAMLL
jgi:hypothetical protein